MPAKSSRQYGAMQAAAHGIGGLGIPQSVGREFVGKTPAKKRRTFAKALAQHRRNRKEK